MDDAPVYDHQAGVAAALAGHAERMAAAKASKFKRQPPPAASRILGGETLEPKAKTKKADFNEATKSWLEKRGYKFSRVDHYDAHAGVHRDFLGLFDYMAFKPGEVVGVQVTSKANGLARAKKIQASNWLPVLAVSGMKSLVLGFYKNDSGRWEAEERWL